MRESRPALFRGRHFRSDLIVLCVRWYLRYPLSYRDLEEMMAERGLALDHSTIARWVLYYAPILNRRIRREMRRPNRSWRVDETYVRVAGKWTYLYRAIDSAGDTIDFLLSPNRESGCGQRLSSACIECGAGPAASHQCGWPSSLRVRNRRTEAGGRTGQELPMPAIAIHEQHH
jgi:transposase-like protein